MNIHTQYEDKVLQPIKKMKIWKDSLLKSQGRHYNTCDSW